MIGTIFLILAAILCVTRKQLQDSYDRGDIRNPNMYRMSGPMMDRHGRVYSKIVPRRDMFGSGS